MRIDLTGVLPTGAPQRSGVPDPHQTVSIPQGANIDIHVKVVDGATGAAVSLLGATVTLAIKKKPADNPPAIFKTAASPSAEAVFLLVPADTKNMVPGRFVYDVWVTTGVSPNTVRNPVVPLSTLILEAAATPPP